MRQILIVSNNDVFRNEQQRNRADDVPVISPTDLRKLPVGASILAGHDESFGYVMLDGKAIGTVAISASDIRAGAINMK